MIEQSLAAPPLNNFSSTLQIVTALSSTPIERLRHTRKALTRESLERLGRLREIVHHSDNYAAMRNRMKQLGSQCIPFLGCYLTLLVKTDENSTYLQNSNLVNFFKFRKLAGLINELGVYQQHVYAIQPVPYLVHHLGAGLQFMTVPEQDAASQRIEPRQSKRTT